MMPNVGICWFLLPWVFLIVSFFHAGHHSPSAPPSAPSSAPSSSLKTLPLSSTKKSPSRPAHDSQTTFNVFRQMYHEKRSKSLDSSVWSLGLPDFASPNILPDKTQKIMDCKNIGAVYPVLRFGECKSYVEMEILYPNVPYIFFFFLFSLELVLLYREKAACQFRLDPSFFLLCLDQQCWFCCC